MNYNFWVLNKLSSISTDYFPTLKAHKISFFFHIHTTLLFMDVGRESNH